MQLRFQHQSMHEQILTSTQHQSHLYQGFIPRLTAAFFLKVGIATEKITPDTTGIASNKSCNEGTTRVNKQLQIFNFLFSLLGSFLVFL